MSSTGSTTDSRSPLPLGQLPPRIRHILDDLAEKLAAVHPAERVEVVELVRIRLDAIEAQTLATLIEDAADLRRARAAALTSRRSRFQSYKATRRALLLKQNPQLATALNDGRVTAEQIDVISRVSERSNGEALNDPTLLSRLIELPPDQGHKFANGWLTARLSAAEVKAAHEIRRELRSARRGRTDDDLATIVLAGDDVTIEEAWTSVTAVADRMYRQDGGRDIATPQHPRTRSQRLYDAAIEYLTGTNTRSGVARPNVVITVDANQLALPKASLSNGQLVIQAQPASRSQLSPEPNKPAGSGPVSNRAHPRLNDAGGPSPAPNIFDHGAAVGSHPIPNMPTGGNSRTDESANRSAALKPQVAGVGAIPQTELERILCDCALTLMVTDSRGQPLWLSRTQRTATTGQRLALIARDESCVLCDAHHQRCEAHHIIPYNAPARGHTDIDNLALLCGPCHRYLHDNGLTLESRSPRANPLDSDSDSDDPEHDPSSPTRITSSDQTSWTTRPAQPGEIAPRRGPDERKEAA